MVHLVNEGQGRDFRVIDSSLFLTHYIVVDLSGKIFYYRQRVQTNLRFVLLNVNLKSEDPGK